ncbi:MAG: hypothetical protein WBO55_13045 [Rhizobiaceae bacterium]
MIVIEMPPTLSEWLAIALALVTLGLGLGWFMFPARLMRHVGLAGNQSHPEAFGEGRSSLAGFALGLPVTALMFGQPSLHGVLAAGWVVASIGKLAHVLVDGGRGRSILIRLAVCVALAAFGLWQHGLPDYQPFMPRTNADIIPAGVAAITALFGLICLLFPSAALGLMRLQAVEPGAEGEMRGLLAGLYLASSLGVLAGGGIFVQLALGAAWGFTAFGRMISMLSDGANNLFNWLSLLLELTLAILVVAAVFGFAG